jgi:RNA polymerase sigma-70 factor (ECF subfamily)
MGVTVAMMRSLPLRLSLADKDRDSTPFDRLYAEHVSFVWSTLRRLGVSRRHLEDAVQDVFLVVHRRLSTYDAARPARPWLAGIVLRVAHDHRRRTGRKEVMLAPLDEGELPSDRADPLGQAVRGEQVEQLDRLLSALPDKQRVVFVLAEMQDLSSREVGEALGLNINTVNTRLRSARQRFDEMVAALDRKGG